MRLSENEENGITRREFVRETAFRGAAAWVIGAGGVALPTVAKSDQLPAKKTGKTIREPARETKVCREADVVVVDGGPGGIGSAVAAARSG